MHLFAPALLILSLLLQPLFGVIVESAHFSDILHYQEEGTLFLIDIDDTLMIPTQTLGTDIWFQYRLKQHLNCESGYETALNKALGEWEAIRHLTLMQAVEPETPTTLAKLQEHSSVIALTTQGLALATRTQIQLNQLGFDFKRSAPSLNDHYFNNEHGVLYRNGILFTSGTNKGRALLKLLELIEIHPKKIVFINDKLTHLKEVEKQVETASIEFIGLRYSASDARVASFNPAIAEIQWTQSSFAHILSDNEAESLLTKALGK